jgi:sugar phosphate isomerase/epimerase
MEDDPPFHRMVSYLKVPISGHALVLSHSVLGVLGGSSIAVLRILRWRTPLDSPKIGLMKFGICMPVDNAAAARMAGWDFVEESAQSILQPLVADAQWTGSARAQSASLPVRAVNLLVPASIKVVGPTVDRDQLRSYMTTAIARAASLGIRTLVFGSGGARMIPDGFDRAAAHRQVIEFLRMCADILAPTKVVLAVEPLNRGECNQINLLSEALACVREVDHRSIRVLLDSYHLWLENEPVDVILKAGPWLNHVHVSDIEKRAAPGETGKCDYRTFFNAVKSTGYDSTICVEAIGFTDMTTMGPRVLDFLKQQWAAA